jgi:hypothetical protein
MFKKKALIPQLTVVVSQATWSERDESSREGAFVDDCRQSRLDSHKASVQNVRTRE